ncbi:MBOAT family O-acyltransferase [Psychroserpens luteus]|uniref:MBOAT family O-acyltransferase n=1 Tax=Psychroserpens luteus TaxID=1434066 RepID=A0ABW5ZTT9_9FLAO|nr:MBOAT family protein [Psychroserpens luteus]
MVFTSLNFLLFFPAVILLFYITPIKYRWATLLIASYFFYLNIEPVFGLLTAIITLSTYFFTRLIDKVNDDKTKSKYMYLNIAIVLLPLFFFKYFTAINDGIFNILDLYEIRWVLPKITFLLPVGISFYTFMAIGYTIDVYNEEVEAEKNIGIVALFISFFPLILSGPIERAKNMIPQFKSDLKLNPANFSIGLKLMLWGYFMKLVVADRLAIYVDAVYGNLAHHNGDTILFTSLLYPIQVYADLGGYSLIAIGVSKILGLDVMHNFNRPFFATSMAEFWRRWHMSLITWLTDYVYTPLAFSFRRYGVSGIVLALMVTFVLSGVWHGATLNFVVWGVLQGVFLSIEALMNKRKTKMENRYSLKSNFLYVAFSIGLTYFLFSISQVFGRAVTFEDSIIVFEKVILERGSLFLDKTTLAYASIGIFMLLLSDFRDEYFPKKMLLFNNKHFVIRLGSYLCVALLILWIGILNGGQFIYFKF